jgi:PHD/YefM family antitoxin component YafN of YafNO toxin-antitoxin module
MEYVPMSTVSVMDFYRQFRSLVGADASHKKSAMFAAIQERVFMFYKEKKRPLILAIDEAHELNAEILKDLKMIMNQKTVSLLMAGGATLIDTTGDTRSKFTLGDLSTRQKRRRALALLLSELERLRFAEEAYMERIPENLREGEAFASADYTVDLLTDAIVTLGDAF